MKTAQFTPGPWRQTGINVRAGDALICYAMNHHANAETPEPEKLANARLISSAPELLAALEMALESLDAVDVPQEWDCRSKVRAAIAKARASR